MTEVKAWRWEDRVLRWLSSEGQYEWTLWAKWNGQDQEPPTTSRLSGVGFVEDDILYLSSYRVHDEMTDFESIEDAWAYMGSLPVWDGSRYVVALPDFGDADLYDVEAGEHVTRQQIGEDVAAKMESVIARAPFCLRISVEGDVEMPEH